MGLPLSDWVIGGLLLAIQHIGYAFLYILQGILGGASLGIIHLWCLRMKGPVYVATFTPLSIAIAAAMAIIFLGDALHLGSVIGAVLISSGVYAVIWGKAKEEKEREICSSSSLESSHDGTTPLLKGHGVEESMNKSGC
ncbi:hypothetical protein GH714_010859 [Hevea brasiliensis]|uniref:WAT1-related protein n=1 Tax=Hevea brasiliensis TaxID=3981 RepID=A0A6A6M5J8_HEVBR|nr:hypothetical protein GH714_010859 [Hevea brasiliensis]